MFDVINAQLLSVIHSTLVNFLIIQGLMRIVELRRVLQGRVGALGIAMQGEVGGKLERTRDRWRRAIMMY